MTRKRPCAISDEVLESALSRYANVEIPRGIEDRILAKVQERATTRRRLLGATLALAAALVAVTVFPVAHRVESEALSISGDPGASGLPAEHHDVAITAMTAMTGIVTMGPELKARPIAEGNLALRESVPGWSSSIEPVLVDDLQISSLDLSALDLSELHVSEIGETR